MNLKPLSDSILLDETKKAVQKEREMTTQVLHFLREIEVRLLYLERGFSSLHAFCTGYLHYDDSQAYRRISAMRLLKSVPEAESKIRSGELTMTSLTQAQSFFKKMEKTEKPLDLEQKREVLKTLEGKSTREAEKELIKLDPSPLPKKMESQRPLAPGYCELKVVLDDATMEKLERLRELLSHQNLNIAQLIDKLAEMALNKFDPEKKKTKPSKELKQPKDNAMPHAAPKVAATTTTSKTRYTPAQEKQFVWKRDQGRCSYLDPVTQRRCNSKHRLQLDHIVAH